MGRKGVKIPCATKLKYAKLYFEQKMTKSEVGRALGVSSGEVAWWDHYSQVYLQRIRFFDKAPGR